MVVAKLEVVLKVEFSVFTSAVVVVPVEVVVLPAEVVVVLADVVVLLAEVVVVPAEVVVLLAEVVVVPAEVVVVPAEVVVVLERVIVHDVAAPLPSNLQATGCTAGGGHFRISSEERNRPQRKVNRLLPTPVSGDA